MVLDQGNSSACFLQRSDSVGSSRSSSRIITTASANSAPLFAFYVYGLFIIVIFQNVSIQNISKTFDWSI
jgi:hypothetical protein